MLLIANVLSDHRLIPPNRRYKVPSGPEVLTDKISLLLPIHPGQMDRALALDIPNHLRHRVLRRYRYHHVHVIRHQVPFLNPAFLLQRQLAKYLSKVLPQLPVQRLSPTLRNEYHVVFALPFRVV